MKRILVVDDDPVTTRLVKGVVERTGDYEVREENSAVRAMHAAHQFLPDLIVLDIMMPEVDGGDLASRFMADSVLKRVPIVFLTSLVSGTEATHGTLRISGCRALAKPLQPADLVACIQEELAAVGAPPRFAATA
jgi:CheY-like chemotaxis protein